MQLKKFNQEKRRGSKVVSALIAVLVISGVSLCLALAWQNAENSEPELEEPITPTAGEEAGAVQLPLEEPSEEESVVMQAEPWRETAEDGEEDPDADAEPKNSAEEVEGGRPAAYSGAVPQSAGVDNSYFEDAIFFGDSLSTGIPLYQVAGSPDTVAFTGINPDTINTSQVINTPEGKKTILEAAQMYGEKKKVYIMLGGNGLWMDDNTFTRGYQTFITGVKEQYPDAAIYLQSILPVTRNVKDHYEVADNETINHFNLLVQQLARTNGLYYLDVAQAMMDEEGFLPDEASPLDGMHLTPEYYNKWFEYLKTHVVEDVA